MITVDSQPSPRRTSARRRRSSQRRESQQSSLQRNNPVRFINNFIHPDIAEKQKALDEFFLYTSVSGVRFLHSRNPQWFKIISAITLLGSLGMSLYHSSTFVHKFMQPGRPAQLSAYFYDNIRTPSLIVCPIRQYKRLRAEYSSDFCHILTRLWKDAATEPEIDGEKISSFLNYTITMLRHYQELEPNNATLKALSIYSQNISVALPSVALMINVSNAMRILMENYQWNTYEEFMERKSQNDTCMKKYFPKNIPELYKCRLAYAVDDVLKTQQNFEQLQIDIQKPPEIEGFILSCNWWDSSNCTYEIVNSSYGIECIKVSGKSLFPITPELSRYSINFELDTQVFNNQANGWQSDEVRVAVVDERSPMLNATFISGGGGSILDLAVNSITDFYFQGNCGNTKDQVYAFANRDGAEEADACLFRVFNIDHSLFPFPSAPIISPELLKKRKEDWDNIDRLCVQSINNVYAVELTSEIEELFRQLFYGVVKLFKILQSSKILQSIALLPISKECAADSLLIKTRQRAEDILNEIHRIENETSDRNQTLGYTDCLRDYTHPVPTLNIRYYSNSTNVGHISNYIDNVFQLMLDMRKRLTPDHPCAELIPSVREFLKMPFVRRIGYNQRQSELLERLNSIQQRRDARLIYGAYGAENIMRVQMRFRHLYGQVISRADEYNTFRMIADIGSAMGLYFGLSVLTLYEFLVFMFVKDAVDGNEALPDRELIYPPKQRPSIHELHILPPPF